MATKTIITGYESVEHILPADLLDAEKLAEVGGEIVEEFSVQVQRATLETDNLVRVALPADKLKDFCGSDSVVTFADGKWGHLKVDPAEYAITEEIEVDEPEPDEEPLPDPTPDDPLAQTKVGLRNRERNARIALLDCKGRAFLALVAGGMSQEDANEAGTELILKLEKQGLLGAYEVAGGNAKAKAELIAAIVADPPAWWGPAFLAIFEDAL